MCDYDLIKKQNKKTGQETRNTFQYLDADLLPNHTFEIF